MNVVFMGTPDFATGCLSSILEAGHTVSGVFTQPDRPKGRGHKLAFSPVKELALKHQLSVYQPKVLQKWGSTGDFKTACPGCHCGGGIWKNFTESGFGFAKIRLY